MATLEGWISAVSNYLRKMIYQLLFLALRGGTARGETRGCRLGAFNAGQAWTS